MKKVLVTGGTQGVGLATVNLLLNRVMKFILHIAVQQEKPKN